MSHTPRWSRRGLLAEPASAIAGATLGRATQAQALARYIEQATR